MNDGTFGVTAEAEPLDEEVVSRVEGHRYDPVRVLQWRNSALDFHSLDALIASLDEPPPDARAGQGAPGERLHRAAHPCGAGGCRAHGDRAPPACGGCGMSASCRISAN